MARPKKQKQENAMSLEINLDELVKNNAVPLPIVEEPTQLQRLNLEIEIEKAKLELEEIRSKSRALSSRIVDEDEQKIIDKQISRGNESKAAKEKILQQKEYDNVLVTGKFLNRRAPGQMAKLAYIKYEDDPVKWHEMYDGKTCTIPRGFADQINEYYHSPVFIQKDGPIEDSDNPGSQIAEVDRSNKKYAFVGLAYA